MRNDFRATRDGLKHPGQGKPDGIIQAAPRHPASWRQRSPSQNAESAALLVEARVPQQPVRQWVLSFPYSLRLLFASRSGVMGQLLGIVYHVIATHLIKKAGFTRKTARIGAVTLIQRFGSALNLNIHLMCMDARMPRAQGCAGAAHMLFLDGVYINGVNGTCQPVSVGQGADQHRSHPAGPTPSPGASVVCWNGRDCWNAISTTRDVDDSYLAGEAVDAGPLDQLLAHSMMCRDARMPRSAWMRESGHVPHRRRRQPRPQGVRLKRLLLAPCRPCPRATRRINLRTRWARWPASRSMPRWRRGRMNARSWNGLAGTVSGRSFQCNGAIHQRRTVAEPAQPPAANPSSCDDEATLPGRRYRKSACRSLRMVTCGTNSRRRTAKACPASAASALGMARRTPSLSRWILSRGSLHWCRSPGST